MRREPLDMQHNFEDVKVSDTDWDILSMSLSFCGVDNTFAVL